MLPQNWTDSSPYWTLQERSFYFCFWRSYARLTLRENSQINIMLLFLFLPFSAEKDRGDRWKLKVFEGTLGMLSVAHSCLKSWPKPQTWTYILHHFKARHHFLSGLAAWGASAVGTPGSNLPIFQLRDISPRSLPFRLRSSENDLLIWSLCLWYSLIFVNIYIPNIWVCVDCLYSSWKGRAGTAAERVDSSYTQFFYSLSADSSWSTFPAFSFIHLYFYVFHSGLGVKTHSKFRTLLIF